MTAKFSLKIVIGTLLAAAIAVAAAVAVVPHMLDLGSYRAQILAAAQKALNRRVSYETADFSWQFPPAIMIRSITIGEKSGDETFLKAEQLTFKLALLPLLHKEARLREIVVERPQLMIDRNQAGAFNFDDLVSGTPSGFEIHLDSVRIRNGLVRFKDHLNHPRGFSASLENLDLYVNGLDRGKTSSFKLSTTIPDGNGQATVAISGMVKIPTRHESLTAAKFDVKLSAKNVNAGRFWHYYGRYLPFERVRGQLDIEEVFEGRLTEFATKGNLRIRDLWLRYPGVFHAPLNPRDVRLAYEVTRTPRDISLQSFDLDVDGFRAKGSCALGDIPSGDPHINARVAVSPFRLEDFHHYIPYGIIPTGTANFIEQHVNGGIFQVDEGKLNGRVSRISRMEQGDNYNVLLVRIRVDKGVMSFGPEVPLISGIKGTLEMRGKDFTLSRMTGSFGSAPFALDGKIADYPLATPCSYPFTMTITPGEAEVAWLLRQGNPSALAFSGQSKLSLAGSGTADDYRLSGSWDLSRADYRYQQQVRKPAGMANQLRFSARLGNSEARLENLHFELPTLDATATATYRYNDQSPLAFALTTNQFTVEKLLPMVPELQKYRPSGRMQAEINGSGNPAEADDFKVAGDVKLSEFSVQLSEHIKPLHNIDGTIRITGTTLETEQLTGLVGSSAFEIRGSLAGFADPAVTLAFSAPQLHPEDFGFYSSGQVPEVKNLAGSISLKKDHLTISSLAGVAGSSEFKLSGEVRDFGSPRISLHADFPQLRVEELVLLTGLKRAGTEGEPLDISLKARVTSGEGSFRDIPFKLLDTEFSLEKNLLDVQAFRAGMFGGTVSGSGKADFATHDGPAFQANYRLEHVDAARLMDAAGVKRYLAGAINATGELTAQGDTTEKLKNNARSSADLLVTDGMMVLAADPGENAANEVPFKKVQTRLSYAGKVLDIHSANIEAFGGTVTGSGKADLAAIGGPAYQAQYHLDHVDSSQILRAAGAKPYVTGMLKADGELTARGGTSAELKIALQGSAELTLTDGVLKITATGEKKAENEAPFKTLQARLSYSGKVLDIHSASFEAFGGTGTGSGKADFSVPESPDYRFACNTVNINSAAFLKAIDATKDISGLLSLQADLSFSGNQLPTVKRTVQGSLALHLEKGIIYRYGLISKVFSLLNVSQLLDFRLPDLMTTGTPYDHIDGTYAFKDGKITTNDLTIHSPAVSMTIVGDANLVTRDLDVKIGVQPFQTVGKVINRIPVIGWILTGGKKRVLVVYYEAKGKWDDPTVTTLPMDSITTGVHNIFKRAFNLPEMLITEPGNVLLGN